MTDWEEEKLREKIAGTVILGANAVERRELEDFYRRKAVREFEKDRDCRRCGR